MRPATAPSQGRAWREGISHKRLCLARGEAKTEPEGIHLVSALREVAVPTNSKGIVKHCRQVYTKRIYEIIQRGGTVNDVEIQRQSGLDPLDRQQQRHSVHTQCRRLEKMGLVVGKRIGNNLFEWTAVEKNPT
jgi:hypothetical protein